MIGLGLGHSVGRGIAGRRGGNASGTQPRIPITLARGGSSDPTAILHSLFGEPAGGSARLEGALPRIPDGPTSPWPGARQPVATRPRGRSGQAPTRPPERPGEKPARSRRPQRAPQERPSVTPHPTSAYRGEGQPKSRDPQAPRLPASEIPGRRIAQNLILKSPAWKLTDLGYVRGKFSQKFLDLIAEGEPPRSDPAIARYPWTSNLPSKWAKFGAAVGGSLTAMEPSVWEYVQPNAWEFGVPFGLILTGLGAGAGGLASLAMHPRFLGREIARSAIGRKRRIAELNQLDLDPKRGFETQDQAAIYAASRLNEPSARMKRELLAFITRDQATGLHYVGLPELFARTP